jgi:hypothetical protein
MPNLPRFDFVGSIAAHPPMLDAGLPATCRLYCFRQFDGAERPAPRRGAALSTVPYLTDLPELVARRLSLNSRIPVTLLAGGQCSATSAVRDSAGAFYEKFGF